VPNLFNSYLPRENKPEKINLTRFIVTEARRSSFAIAARIVSGESASCEDAMTIWKTILNTLPNPIPDDLWPFKSRARAIEDYVWNFEQGGG